MLLLYYIILYHYYIKPSCLVEAGPPRWEAFDDSSGPMTTEWLCHYDGTTTAWRRHDDEATTVRRRSDDRHKPGSGVQPQLMTCQKLDSAPNPGLWHVKPGLVTVVALSSHRRACRRQAVVMPSVYRRRAVGTSSSCCWAIVVRPSAHCRRAVVSIVISTRRDFSYPTIVHVFWIMLN